LEKNAIAICFLSHCDNTTVIEIQSYVNAISIALRLFLYIYILIFRKAGMENARNFKGKQGKT